VQDSESDDRYGSQLCSLDEVVEFAERNLLFQWGKLDLKRVRSWHLENSRPGGVVLREIVEAEVEDEQWREGYFLYYETTGKGERLQQVFVRGTSNSKDIWVDLATAKEWDEECGCYLHAGFNNRADLLLQDLEPVPPPHSIHHPDPTPTLS